jgi:hypothetical protein
LLLSTGGWSLRAGPGIKVETFRPVERKHLLEVFSFHRMQNFRIVRSFHVVQSFHAARNFRSVQPL